MNTVHLTPSLKVQTSYPFEDEEDFWFWEEGMFGVHSIDVIMTVALDQDTPITNLSKAQKQQVRAAKRKGEPSVDLHIGDIQMYNIETSGGVAWQIAEYYSASVAFAIDPLMAGMDDEAWPISDALERRLALDEEFCGDVWYLEYVRLDPAWRGRGWGRWAMATAIWQLVDSGDPVSALPAPLEFPGRPNSNPPTKKWKGFPHAQTALAANLRRIGFRNFIDGYMLLDTDSPAALEKLYRWKDADRISPRSA